MNTTRLGTSSLLVGALLLSACSDDPSSGEGSPTGGERGGLGGDGSGSPSNGGASANGNGASGGSGARPSGGSSSSLGGSASTPSGGTGSGLGGTANTSGGVPGALGGAASASGGTANALGGASSSMGGDTESGGASASSGGSGGGNPGTVGCDRGGLEAAVDSYLAALRAGDPSLMPLSDSIEYVVNDDAAPLAAGEGLFQWAAEPDFHRNLLDVEACRTFTEIICATWSHQYVLGVALTVTGSEISEIYVVETDEGDWAFGADNYLSRSQQEDWSLIPEGERPTREELDSGARAYFAYWGDKSVDVPWGDPCARMEGGSFGAFELPLRDEWTEDQQWGSCSIGIPDQGFAPQPRESIIDPDHGMIVLLLNLGGEDSHLFRFEKDASLSPRTGFDHGMVYVHTLTEQ